jgi:hypothetical protein
MLPRTFDALPAALREPGYIEGQAGAHECADRPRSIFLRERLGSTSSERSFWRFPRAATTIRLTPSRKASIMLSIAVVRGLY